jgi:hypothetical protein
MAKLRNAMLVAVLAATALAALGGYFFLQGPPARLLVDAGLAMALGVIIVVTLAPTMARVTMLIDALQALARGDKHQRVNPDDFAGLAGVARALNEVAASLTVDDDPNLGPVRSTYRPRPVTHVRRRELADDSTGDHPDVGPVRVIKKPEPKAEAAEANGESGKNGKEPAMAAGGTRVLPSERAGDSEIGVGAGSDRPQAAERTNDTAIDEAPRSDAASAEPEIAQVPSRAELEALFQEFVAAKKSKDESVVDLDLDAFAQTIQGECERLITAHQCKGVRFEVTMQDGEVSLRPRLLR